MTKQCTEKTKSDLDYQRVLFHKLDMTKHILPEYKIESFTVGTVGSSSSLSSLDVFHILAYDYISGKPSIIKIWFFFLDALFCHSGIVIYSVHSWNINICQKKDSQAKKKNEKYIIPFPWLVIINILYWFGEFGSSRYTEEFSRWSSGLKNFTHPQVYVHPHEISRHSSLISTKYTNVSFVEVLRFGFKYGMRLVIYTRTKNIIYHIVGRNHLIDNGYLWNIIKE